MLGLASPAPHPFQLDCFSLWSPGPRLFLSCPIDVDGSRVWFTDLWNYSIIPYLLEAVREGLQVRAHCPLTSSAPGMALVTSTLVFISPNQKLTDVRRQPLPCEATLARHRSTGLQILALPLLAV